MKFLGHKLKELRKAKKMTMVQLQDITGIKQNTISLYENGKKFPSTETAVKFSEALNVDLYYFYLESAVHIRCAQGSPGAKTSYAVLGERAENARVPIDMLESIIAAWEKKEAEKEKQDGN